MTFKLSVLLRSANNEDPAETTHNAASHQGLHCLPKRKSIYVKIIKKNQPDIPSMKNELYQIIMVEAIRLKRVK